MFLFLFLLLFHFQLRKHSLLGSGLHANGNLHSDNERLRLEGGEGGRGGWEVEEGEKLRWEEEEHAQVEQDVRIRLVVEKDEEREALILQGSESESESLHWDGRNGCSGGDGVRTKSLEETDYLEDHSDGGEEDGSLDFQVGTDGRRWSGDDGDRTLDEEMDKKDEDEEEDGGLESADEERRRSRGSRTDSLHFFLEQLVGDEGWRECVEVFN